MLSASATFGDPSILHSMSSQFISLAATLHSVFLWFLEKDLRETSKCCIIEKEGRRASHSCHFCQMVNAHGLLWNESMSDSTTENRKKGDRKSRPGNQFITLVCYSVRQQTE